MKISERQTASSVDALKNPRSSDRNWTTPTIESLNNKVLLSVNNIYYHFWNTTVTIVVQPFVNKINITTFIVVSVSGDNRPAEEDSLVGQVPFLFSFDTPLHEGIRILEKNWKIISTVMSNWWVAVLPDHIDYHQPGIFDTQCERQSFQ